LQRLDSRDVTELIAAENIGPPRWVKMICTQLGLLLCMYASVHRKSGAPAPKVEAFLPWKEPRREQSVEEQMMICEALGMMNFGGEDNDLADGID
jgi:hypothetical protein